MAAAVVTESLGRLFGLLEAFKAFDSDNDGRITAAELGGLLASLGHEASEEEVNLLLLQGDGDGDGLLTAEEFLAAQMTKDAEHLDVVVGLLDVALQISQGESLPQQELCQGLEGTFDWSPEECKGVAAAMDGDGDGVITVEHLCLFYNAFM
ncbi:hypothetical protein Taro_033551 [Colocasia esculenta]|uniref:EF-hand domain-containing protein n=1 Tax=Colocasia esculenta TaxID=4460 RepID=A0A843W7A7_COLES|nr:hypothetical protein [Colocasia esculenta]